MNNTQEDYEKSEQLNNKLEIIMQSQENLKKDVDEYKTLKSSTTTLEEQKNKWFKSLGRQAQQARDILNNQKIVVLLAEVSSNDLYNVFIFKYLKYFWLITTTKALEEVLKHLTRWITK